MTNPAEPTDTTEPGKVEPETWHVIGIDYDRRNVEWTLWGFGDECEPGKVEANGGQFFEGPFEQAASHWRAFTAN